MGLAVAEGQGPQIVSRSCTVFGVIEQEPTIARPAGWKMPQPGLAEQHLRVADAGGGLHVHRVAETARRVRNAGAVRRPHAGRVRLLLECETREAAAAKSSVQRSPGTLYGVS